MRDPNRIDVFCARLKQIWRHVPDWRFGQLMWNVITECQAQGKDAFYMEDEEMLKLIHSYIAKTVKTNIGDHDCSDCRHGKFNDHWNMNFCYNPQDCHDWDHWEPKEENI